jgi:heme exporter protein B
MKALKIAKKDLLIEFRTKHTINFMLLFALLSILMFSYIVGAFIAAVPDIGPGLLWLILIFSGMLGLSRAFTREKDLGTLEGLKLSPVSGTDILLGKVAYNFSLLVLIEVISFPIFLLFFNFPVAGSIALSFFYLTLGNLGFAVVGSAMSVLILNARARELLLPVILFPVLFPIIISSISALKKVLVEGETFLNTMGEFKIIIAYTVIMAVISLLTFDYALEE